MRVTVLGLGHVGSVTAACLARDGHEVVGVDTDPERIAAFRSGSAPVQEPGLASLVAEATGAGRLWVTADALEAVADSTATLICVGTPHGPDGRADLGALDAAVDRVGAGLAKRGGSHVVAIRSTVPPGTTRHRIGPALRERAGANVGVAVLPEFFREGHALADHAAMGFPVLGTDDPSATARLLELAPAGTPGPRVVPTDTAEAVKLACNAWHALKVGFANEIDRWCQARGIDGTQVMATLAADVTLNTGPAYLRPGFAFGGPCLPKDLAALLADAADAGTRLPVLQALVESNRRIVADVVAEVRRQTRGPVGLLGLGFKPGTGDVRGSPFLDLALDLIDAGVQVVAFDPDVRPQTLPDRVRQVLTPHESALDACELLLVADPALLDGLPQDRTRPVRMLSHLRRQPG